jgi:catechol 2,3-dioxygenase
VNLHPVDAAGMLRFFRDILEFRISDAIGEDFAYFLRCNSEHHGIGIIKGRGWMHHHAWQLGSIAELGQIADRLYEHGEHLLMGITRHGAGRNLAAYYVEPTGAVVELYTDMEHIYDDDRPAVHWDREGSDFATLWAPHDMTEFRSHGLFPAIEAIVAK